MICETIKVTNPKGIHARPSSMLFQTASSFHSNITLELRDIKANAKEIMSILTLGATCGDDIHVTVEGMDEKEAMLEIKNIFAMNFGDE